MNLPKMIIEKPQTGTAKPCAYSMGCSLNHMLGKVWNEIIYPFANFNGAAVKVWEWMSNFTPYFIMDVIAYPCWD